MPTRPNSWSCLSQHMHAHTHRPSITLAMSRASFGSYKRLDSPNMHLSAQYHPNDPLTALHRVSVRHLGGTNNVQAPDSGAPCRIPRRFSRARTIISRQCRVYLSRSIKIGQPKKGLVVVLRRRLGAYLDRSRPRGLFISAVNRRVLNLRPCSGLTAVGTNTCLGEDPLHHQMPDQHPLPGQALQTPA